MADKDLLESVQRRAVRMFSNLKGTYEQKLKVLAMAMLEENRVRGDMIEMYKMMTGKNKSDFTHWFRLAVTREGAGNTRGRKGFLNVEEPPISSSNICKYTFSQRCPGVWNALPDTVKLSTSVNGFKAAYDQTINPFIADKTCILL